MAQCYDRCKTKNILSNIKLITGFASVLYYEQEELGYFWMFWSYFNPSFSYTDNAHWGARY